MEDDEDEELVGEEGAELIGADYAAPAKKGRRAVIESDEDALGAALYGEGKRVRAALIDHKGAVIVLLERLMLQA